MGGPEGSVVVTHDLQYRGLFVPQNAGDIVDKHPRLVYFVRLKGGGRRGRHPQEHCVFARGQGTLTKWVRGE